MDTRSTVSLYDLFNSGILFSISPQVLRGTLFPRIKLIEPYSEIDLIELYSRKQSSTHKSMTD